MTVFDVNSATFGTARGRPLRQFPRPRSVALPRPKVVFDLTLAILLLPVVVLVGLVLLLCNPVLNPGPLMYSQRRMGQDGRGFRALKFRSMTPARAIERGAFEGLEANRILPFGHFLRMTRLDELPQILNVLAGDMSFIGPRPDYFDHALVYLGSVPGYGRRLALKPGISGFAQTRVGYVDGLEGVRRKVAADLIYLRRASFLFDLWIVWRTLCTVAFCRGR